MSRSAAYSVLCLILITLTPISSSNAADLQSRTGSEQNIISGESPGKPPQAGVAPQESLAQNKASVDAASSEETVGVAFKMPLPGTLWLMAGGLLALLLIRRRNK
jgi:hypothetical protein